MTHISFQLCLDVAASSQVHSLLFQDNQKISDEFAGIDQFSFDLASEDDFADIFEHYCATSGSMDTESIETGFEDLKVAVRCAEAPRQSRACGDILESR